MLLPRRRHQPPVLQLHEIEAQFRDPQDGKRLTPEAFWHLLALYDRCAEQYRSRLRGCVLSMGVTYLLSVLDAINGARYCLVSVIASCCLVIAYLFLRYAPWSIRPFAEAIRALSRIRTSTDIRSLIAMLEYCNKLPVRYDLARLLGGLQMSDTPALADWERWYLRDCLERAVRQRNEPVAIAALGALERAGVTAALPRVRRFAKAADEDTIREAARRCLQALKSYAEQERSGSSLLRAATAPKVAYDVLLRPADETADHAPQQLLRSPNP